MKNYIKYICAILLVLGTSAHAWGTTYQRITSLSELSNGDVIIVTRNEGDGTAVRAMGKTVQQNVKYDYITVTASNGKISYSGSDILQLTVRVNTSNTPTLYAFWTGSGFLYDTGNNNEIKVNDKSYSAGLPSGQNWVWTMNMPTSSNSNHAIDVVNGSATGRGFQYYASGSTGYFASHTNNNSGVNSLCIWKVSCEQPTLTFSNPTSYTKTIGDAGFTKTATLTGGGTGQTISYSSSNNNIASVNSSTGAVTIGSTAGTATITASVQEKTVNGTTYCEATATYTITVNPVIPTLSANTTGKLLTATSITSTSAVLSGGIITNKGGGTISSYGFVYGTSTNPTTSNSSAVFDGDKSINVAFGEKTITGLTPNTTYHVRVYAVNSAGTGYSPTEITFTTLQRYTLTYKKNDGSSFETTSSKDAGATVQLAGNNAFSRSGYSLTSWTTNSDGTGTSYLPKADYSADADLTVYAQWTPITYGITYKDQGNKEFSGVHGSGYPTQFVYNVSTPLVDPTKVGYGFEGWFTNQACTGDAITAIPANTYASNITVYAKWSANVIHLELSANGGENDGEADVLYDATGLKAGTLEHASYEGHTLQGYYDDDSHTHKVLNNDGSFAGDVDGFITSGKWCRTTTPTTLYAWWAVNPQTVTFDLQGKGDDIVRIVDYDTKVTAPATPTHVDYNFVQWVTTAGGNTPFNFNQNITSDVTVYAQWTPKSYEHLIFACTELNVETEDGDPVLVTSRSGINVMGTKKLKVSVSGAIAGHRVTLTGTDLKFYRNDGTRYIELTGSNSLVAPLDEQIVYVSYNPSSGGTGAIATPDITVACDGYEDTFSALIKARNLPNAVAIVARVGDSWQALPADISSPDNPEPVMVTAAVDGVLKAYGPSTLSYQLWSTAVVASNNSRWGDVSTAYTPSALYGDRLRFSGVSNHPLWANNSNTSNKIEDKSDATLNNVGHYFTNDAGYEWKVTTTVVNGQFVYTLQTDQTQNTNYLRLWGKKWGTYDDSHGIADLYILPLVVTEPAEISIYEWGTDAVAIKYANYGNVTSGTFKAKVGTGDAVSVTPTQIGGTGDIYRVAVSGLQANPSKTLVLSMTESSTDKQAVFPIPLIVTTEQTEAAISALVGANLTEGRKVAKGLDVVIRNGGKLTNTSSESGVFADLYIYPGGKVDLTQKIAFNNIYLRGGFSWLDATKDYRLPQMKVADEVVIDNIDKEGNGIYYDLTLDYTMYYTMALPKDAALSTVTNEEGVKKFTAGIKKYNGGARAGDYSAGSTAWIRLTSGNLSRGAGYEVTIKPRNNRIYGVLRFPLLQATAWTNEADCTPTVTAWGVDKGDAVSDNNKGWNFIGNPFFTAFQSSDANGQLGTNMEIRDLAQHKEDGNWTGTYDWTSSTVKYVTIPNKLDVDYTDERTKNYKLESFYPFFIQAKISGDLVFAGTKVLKKPSVARQKVQEREIELDFELHDANGNSDKAGLTISNEYSAAFDMDDKEKTILNGTEFMKVYTIVGEYRTAFNALPEEAAAQPIPVGYIAPTAGGYKFILPESGDYTQVSKVMLSDYSTGATVDLLTALEGYSFETEAGEFKERFALNVILKAEGTTTDVSSVDGSGIMDISVFGGEQHLVVRGVPTGANVWVYDATGKLVAAWNNVREANLWTEVPAAGVYSVRAVMGTEGVTKRAVVR